MYHRALNVGRRRGEGPARFWRRPAGFRLARPRRAAGGAPANCMPVMLVAVAASLLPARNEAPVQPDLVPIAGRCWGMFTGSRSPASAKMPFLQATRLHMAHSPRRPRFSLPVAPRRGDPRPRGRAFADARRASCWLHWASADVVAGFAPEPFSEWTLRLWTGYAARSSERGQSCRLLKTLKREYAERATSSA